MLSTFRPFFIKLALFSIVILGILLAWQHFASVHFQTKIYWVIWLFFIITTAMIHIILGATRAMMRRLTQMASIVSCWTPESSLRM